MTDWKRILPLLLLAVILTGGMATAQTLQTLINNAAPGSTVLVPPGIYTGPGNKNLDFGGKDIKFKSTAGPASTIIDCQFDGRGFYFHSGETSAAVVNGFTVINGQVDFTTHVVNGGSGIAILGASPTIRRCTFMNGSVNTAALGLGGGVYLNNSDSTFIRCNIAANNSGTSLGIGGGVYVTGGAMPAFRSCCMVDNTSYFGGGLHTDGASLPLLQNVTVAGNLSQFGGGLATSAAFTNAGATLYNTIVWGNTTTGGGAEVFDQTGLVTATYSDIAGGWPGVGNLNVDPLYVNAAASNYHLRRQSPVINQGDPNFNPAPNKRDIDGQQRVWVRVDMGYDELAPYIIQIDPVPYP